MHPVTGASDLALGVRYGFNRGGALVAETDMVLQVVWVGGLGCTPL